PPRTSYLLLPTSYLPSPVSCLLPLTKGIRLFDFHHRKVKKLLIGQLCLLSLENSLFLTRKLKKSKSKMIAETKDEMRERILEAALKRFTHYGSAKTTMNEIADDLGCSKASLYYYFPDKKGLHKAVLMKIADDFFAEMEAEADHISSAAECLRGINEIRSNFLQRFCRLELFKVMNETQTEEMQRLIKEAKERDHR